MFYFIFVLCCKDTTKSNDRQIFKGKSYHIVYHLTFLNRKIKYYYLFMYYLLYYYYYILYVSYYIIYLIIYRERTKAKGREGRPPRPRPLPLRQVVKVGQRASQGGRSPASQPADPLHPAGVRPNICGHLRRGGGQRSAIAGRRGCSARKFVSGFFARLYRSKYQLFIFSEGLSRAKPTHLGNGNCT